MMLMLYTQVEPGLRLYWYWKWRWMLIRQILPNFLYLVWPLVRYYCA